MTEYVAIPDSDLEVDDGIKSEHALAWNNNLLAVNEMDPTALAAGVAPAGPWLVDDGAGGYGPYYDFDVDGSETNVISPDFGAGYDYRIVGQNMSQDGAGNPPLQASWYLDNAAVYTSALSVTGGVAPTTKVQLDLSIGLPFRTSQAHFYSVLAAARATGDAHINLGQVEANYIGRLTADKISRLKLSFVGANFGGGKVWLFKRKRQEF